MTCEGGVQAIQRTLHGKHQRLYCAVHSNVLFNIAARQTAGSLLCCKEKLLFIHMLKHIWWVFCQIYAFYPIL